MEEKTVTLEQFQALLKDLGAASRPDEAFLYQCFLDAVDSSSALKDQSPILAHMPLNPVQLVLYLLNEEQFYLETNPDKKLEDLEKDEGYEQFLISVALDKYFTNEHLSYRSGSFVNRFVPEISTINLYLNFILGMLSRYKQGDPKETLVVDILQKGFSMAKCIVDLLTNGFETEAFSTWRTLHENECILQVIVKYGQPVIDEYLKHLKYALAFRGALPTKEETDQTFEEIKAGMKSVDLKSKDMKRYIEYGWLLGIPNVMQLEGFKFNFRDGVERCAGLRDYSKVYEMSSEIAHSSPLLIYSRKNYFYLITMLNLYESFFRLEKIFSTIYLSTVPEADQKQYVGMRKLYFSELLACYDLEKKRFAALTSSNKSEVPPENSEDSSED
jgi:hypothetical protein